VDLDGARATVAKFATVARALSGRSWRRSRVKDIPVGRPATLFSEIIMVSEMKILILRKGIGRERRSKFTIILKAERHLERIGHSRPYSFQCRSSLAATRNLSALSQMGAVEDLYILILVMENTVIEMLCG